jgi:hypothetical protein
MSRILVLVFDTHDDEMSQTVTIECGEIHISRDDLWKFLCAVVPLLGSKSVCVCVCVEERVKIES